MTELEIAFVALLILAGVAAIVHAGLRAQKPRSAPSDRQSREP